MLPFSAAGLTWYNDSLEGILMRDKRVAVGFDPPDRIEDLSSTQ